MLACLGAAIASGCDRGATLDVRSDRDACETCHRSLSDKGVESGIETAHAGFALECVDCHGGTADATNEPEAHGARTTQELRGKSTVGLTQVPASYVRLVNPSDLRIASTSCGSAACHATTVAAVQRSLTATFAGALTQPRRLLDEDARAVGVVDAADGAADLARGAVPSIEVFPHPAALGDGDGALLDEYLRKACARCHAYDFGTSRACGDFRGSGCGSCHVPYSADAVSASADAAGRPSTPAARSHRLVRTPEEAACARCHVGGARIALAFHGKAPAASTGYLGLVAPPPEGETCDDSLAVQDVAAGPDAHAAAGMTCTDCHVGGEVHGTASLYASRYESPSLRCTDCHGDAEQPAAPDRDGRFEAAAGWALANLSARGDDVVLRTGAGAELEVPQLAALDVAPEAHGPEHGAVACASCHSKFTITCAGCHVTIDEESVATSPSLIDAQNGLAAAVVEEGFAVDTASFLLGEAPDGTVYPIVPAQAVLLSHVDATGALVVDRRLATNAGGTPAIGYAAIEPHTVGPARDCDACHVAPDGSNLADIQRLVGAAASTLVVTDGAGQEWDLGHPLDDALAPRWAAPSGRARPLAAERARLLLEEPVR